MMHHTNHQPHHQRHLRFQDENALMPSNSSNGVTKGGNNSNKAAPFKPRFQDNNNNAALAKTPKQKPSSRRAFGDISNKKRSHQAGSNNSSGKSGLGGQPQQQPVVQKLHLSSTTTATNNNNKSLKKPSRAVNNNNNQSKQVSFVLADRTNTMGAKNQDNNNKINRRSATPKKAHASSLPSFDLTGLDPVEQPAGRTWSQQERWSNDFGTESIPKPVDMNQVFANRRRARQLEEERIEEEGWALLQQEIEQMHIKDEADLDKMTQDFYSKLDDDDSFDAMLQSRIDETPVEETDDCFLDISF